MARKPTPAQRFAFRQYPVPPRPAPEPRPAESWWLTAPREGFGRTATQHRFSGRSRDLPLKHIGWGEDV